MSTTGHESEAVNVGGLKAMMQKFKTDKVDAPIALINNLIPSQASAQNKLADKAFVNSSIATATATYRGNYNLVSDLELTIDATEAQTAGALATAIQTADNNDYCYVQVPTDDDKPAEIARVDRYKNNGTAWAFEYSLNSSGFTASQWAAVNSGITSGLVAKLTALPSMAELAMLLDGKISNPIELSSLSADYTFSKGDTIIVGTGLYKCNVATTTLPPFNFVFDANGSVVIDTINGYEAVAVDSDTLNTGWEKVMEVSDRYYTEMRVAQMDSRKADKATTAAGYGITDVYTKNQVDALTRHTRLTDFDLDVLKKAVAEQNLEKYGLKVGDEKTINGHTYVIAGLNCMKGSHVYRVNTNHVGLIVIPHTTQKWNESGNTYTGADGRGAGYLNSDLHYYLKNTVLPMCNTDLGATNLISHNKLLTNAVNTNGINRFGEASGCTSGWGWEDTKICALSEVQVFGSSIWSSSGFDTSEACRQLEVFQKYSHTEIFKGEYPWLRDVVSASQATTADYRGIALCDTASNANYVAALILFH